MPQNPEHGFLTSTVADEVATTGRPAGPRGRRRRRCSTSSGSSGSPPPTPTGSPGASSDGSRSPPRLAHRPGLVLLDEPTVGQDPGTWAAVAGWIDVGPRGAGATVAVSTHDADLRLDAEHPMRARECSYEERWCSGSTRWCSCRSGCSRLLGSFWIRSLPVGPDRLRRPTPSWPLLVLPGWRYPLVCLGFTAVAALTIVYSTWRLGGRDWRRPFTAGLRIVVLAWPGSVMAGYVDPSRLADYLAQSLHLPGAAGRGVRGGAAAVHRLRPGLAAARPGPPGRAASAPSRNPVANGRYAANMSFALLVQAMRGAIGVLDRDGRARLRDRPATAPGPSRRRGARLDVLADRRRAALLGAVPIVAHLI